MASRFSFHSQLSAIMETVARSALSQVCKLVDEDSAELRLRLSQLMVANSALAEKVNSLECELTAVRSDAPRARLCKSNHSISVQTQTVCRNDKEEAHVSGSPTIDGIFGKDWCMNLWKDRDPYSLERDLSQPSEESVATSNQITLTEIKQEDYVEEAVSCCQETFSTAESEEGTAVEPEPLSVAYSVDSSACSLSFDPDEEQLVCAGGIKEPTMQLISIADTEDAFSNHIIPIEDDDDDDDDGDLQFVEESQQALPLDAEDGPIHDKQHTQPANSSENSTTLEKDSHDDFNLPNGEIAKDPDEDKFTCQICGRTFFHKGTLTHHMKSHKFNFCNICKQHFPHMNKLNTLHTCVPPLACQSVSRSCELCGKTFANPSALRIHYFVHTGEKPHRCSFCGKGFTQKGNLKCHLRIHTGERPFYCVKCGKTFTQKINLNHHLLTHRAQNVQVR